MKADKIRKTVMFCCGGYRSVYAGNFIPSLLGIEEKLAPNNPCVYVFHRTTACRSCGIIIRMIRAEELKNGVHVSRKQSETICSDGT